MAKLKDLMPQNLDAPAVGLHSGDNHGSSELAMNPQNSKPYLLYTLSTACIRMQISHLCHEIINIKD